MTALEDAFKLTPEPGYKVVEDAFYVQSLIFENSEILALARFCGAKGDKQPALSVMCEKSGGLDLYIGFRIGSSVPSSEGALINFHFGPNGSHVQLKLFPNQKSDPSGKVISYVIADPKHFPEKEYLDFRGELLREQTISPRAKASRAEMTLQ